MKGKTFLAAVVALLLVLAAWLAWKTKAALDAKEAGTWPISPQSPAGTPGAR